MKRAFSIRTAAELSSIRHVLIVCEGAKSEVGYMEALRALLRLPKSTIEVVHPEATDPIKLLSHAISRRDEIRKGYKRQGVGSEVDVWILVDREAVATDDRRKQLADARQRARGSDVYIADSTPCFEFWLLLHYRFTTKPFDSCVEVGRELKAEVPEYAKDWIMSPRDLTQRLPDAVRHARRCRDHHATAGGENPSTGVDLLAISLDRLALPHNRVLPAEPGPQS